MTKLAIFNRDIDSALVQQLNPVVYLPKVACPYTTVAKRATCTDFSNDLLPRFGIDRVMTQAIQEVQGESGPNGERVFKPINDAHDAVRFVGSWASVNNTYGPHILSATANDYLEITFYGTGLNLLCGDNNMDLRASLDGGAEGSDFYLDNSGILGARGYSPNYMIPVFWSGGASSTTLGLHTVKIKLGAANDALISGYEVLNTTSTLQQTPGTSYLGGKRLYASALTTSSPTSGFTNTYGTAGTKGSHVLVYQKPDGTVAKDARYTEVAAAYLTSASHTNEDVIRTYHWREFGAGRTDDFSLLAGTQGNKAFTLDDGTTTLVGSQVFAIAASDGLSFNANSDFCTFTFVGTGCDIVRQDNASGGSDTYSLTVDGVAAGNLSSTGNTTKRIEKLASGLPYGTHTVKITRVAAATYNLMLTQLITYGPSKPALPAGCVELGDYYVVADYAFNSAGSISGNESKNSNGILCKPPLREAVYSGTWTVSALTPGTWDKTGFATQSSTTTNYIEYTFCGTGVEALATYSTSLTVSVLIDGAAPASAASVFGGSYSNPTWTLSDNANGSKITFTGLTFGKHTIRLTINTISGAASFSGFNIITPIHAVKGNLPGDIQNTQNVGSCAISDNRKFTALAVKPLANWAQAVGVTSGPTTSSASLVPVPDLSVTIKTNGNPIDISYYVRLVADTTGRNMQTAVFVDGVQVSTNKAIDTASGNFDAFLTDRIVVPVAAGVHKVDVYWLISAGTATAKSTSRNLTVMEL